jgi:hypothetical protein
MAMIDIFSIIMILGISVVAILCGWRFMYLDNQINAQNHKLMSMANLVSVLAGELEIVKSRLGSNSDGEQNIQYSSDIMIGGSDDMELNAIDLISVSDGDVDEDEESVEEDEETVEEDEETVEEDEESVEDEDLEAEMDLEDSESNEQMKLLNLSLANDSAFEMEFEDIVKDIEDVSEVKTIHIDSLEGLSTTAETKETETKDETAEAKETKDETAEAKDSEVLEEQKHAENDFDLKSINISDLSELDDLHASKFDYKKMSLNKLREIVVSKGLIADASKLKKHDILKLLEVEAKAEI